MDASSWLLNFLLIILSEIVIQSWHFFQEIYKHVSPENLVILTLLIIYIIIHIPIICNHNINTRREPC